MDVNRISGYIPGKMVFFLMQVRPRVVLGKGFSGKGVSGKGSVARVPWTSKLPEHWRVWLGLKGRGREGGAETRVRR